MHYDRFLDIYLCTSREPDEDHKTGVRLVSGGYYLDAVNPSGYISERAESPKIGGKSIDANTVEVSNIPINFWERALKDDTRYIACVLDVNYINGSISRGAAKPIPQLKLLMDWICDRSFVSKLMILGHGSGKADGEISCAGHRATAKQLVTALVLNGLQKGNLQRLRPTAIPGALWKPDKGNDTCSCCKGVIKKGVFVSNKHHCRRCGEIVHDECSKTRIALEEALTEKHGLQRNTGRVRVCDTCAYEHNTTWAAPNPNARHAANLDAGLREITLFTCKGALARDKSGFEAVSGNDSFAIQSFAANFVKELRAKNIYGVRVAAANEILSLRDQGKSAYVIDVPKNNMPPHWDVAKDGIPNRTYGWDRGYAEQLAARYAQQHAWQSQRPFTSRFCLIKISPDRSSLFFGLWQDDLEQSVTNSLKEKRWRFPQWRVQTVEVTNGVLGTIRMPEETAAIVQFNEDQAYVRSRMAGALPATPLKEGTPLTRQSLAQFKPQVIQKTIQNWKQINLFYTIQLTPPPGYNIRFEELPNAIRLTGGGIKVPFKDVKIIETS